ncbi:MAG: hypothetical protein KDA53_05350 [Hyphomonas sp.]|nr:hypothetical protein [Hyphomonas sp.]
MKFPEALGRFLRRTKAPPPVAGEGQAPPLPDPETPAPARLDRLNRWLTLGANIGVLLGLVVLIVEVRQNAALTRTAMEQDGSRVLVDIELSLSRPDMAEIWVKSIRTPEDLTAAQARMVESHLVALLLQWNHLFEMEATGLVSRERIERHIRNVVPYYFGSRFAKNWWQFEQDGWQGTPMFEVAGPIIADVDESYLVRNLDNISMSPVAIPPPEDAP